MDPEIHKSKSQKSISFENLKSPHSSGRFDISGPPVPLFVAEISPSRFFVTERTEEELRILVVGLENDLGILSTIFVFL